MASDAPAATRPLPGSRRVGTLGMAFTAVGGLMVVFAFTSLGWYRGEGGVDSVGSIGFGELHAQTRSFDAPQLARDYFGWFSWLVLLATIGLGIEANLPSRSSGVFKFFGFVAGVTGAAVTYFALRSLWGALADGYGADVGVFRHTAVGLWMALAGFVVCGLGAALGPAARE